jgi:hypothetical protein
VWFRHAKAGELCEHVEALHLVHGAEKGEGAMAVEAVASYRGEGRCFL